MKGFLSSRAKIKSIKQMMIVKEIAISATFFAFFLDFGTYMAFSNFPVTNVVRIP